MDILKILGVWCFVKKTEKELEKLIDMLEKEYGVKAAFIITDDGEISFFNDDNVFHESCSKMKVMIDGFESMKKMEWIENHIAAFSPMNSKDNKRYIG